MTNLLRHKLTLVIDSTSQDICSQNSGTALHGNSARDESSTVPDAVVSAASESILLAALEQATNSSWRFVCASLATEQCEPFRTVFLSKEVRNLLRLWYEWQNCDFRYDGTTADSSKKAFARDFCPKSLMIDVDLYRPLERVSQVSLSQMQFTD